MPKVVVIGAGIGGVPMAFELRDLFGNRREIMCRPNSECFQFVPSNPWVAINWRKAEDIKVHLPRCFRDSASAFIAGGRQARRPRRERGCSATATLAYDYLVIATGPKLAFDEIEGLGPQANTSSICHVGPRGRGGAKMGGVLQGPRPDGHRRRPGRLLLRPGL